MFHKKFARQIVTMLLGGRSSFKHRAPSKCRFEGQSAEGKAMAIAKATAKRERQGAKRRAVYAFGVTHNPCNQGRFAG